MKKLNDFFYSNKNVSLKIKINNNNSVTNFSANLIGLFKNVLKVLTFQSYFHSATACDPLAPAQYYNTYFTDQTANQAIRIVFDRTLNVLDAFVNGTCNLLPDAKKEDNYLLEACECPIMLPDGVNKAYYSSLYVYAINATTEMIECIINAIENKICPPQEDSPTPYLIILASAVGLVLTGGIMYACYKKFRSVPETRPVNLAINPVNMFSNASSHRYQRVAGTEGQVLTSSP